MKKKLTKENSETTFTAIDFFCGGGGMTCGLLQSGVKVIAGVDLDPDAKETYEFNNVGATFVNADVKTLASDYFEKTFKVRRNDDSLILVGCSPCQFYSIINTDKGKSQKSKDLLLDFARFIEYYFGGKRTRDCHKQKLDSSRFSREIKIAWLCQLCL